MSCPTSFAVDQFISAATLSMRLAVSESILNVIVRRFWRPSFTVKTSRNRVAHDVDRLRPMVDGIGIDGMVIEGLYTVD